MPVGDMFQKKIHKLFSGMPNVFGIADNILTSSFDELGRDYDVTLDKAVRICRQVSLKLTRDKHLFKCTNLPSFSEVISQQCVSLDPGKSKH